MVYVSSVKQDSPETVISKIPFHSTTTDRCDFALELQIE